MNNVPLILEPYLKTSVWAGDRLRRIYGENADFKIAESWKLSAVPDRSSIIKNDTYKDLSLYDYLIKNDLQPDSFPWIIKILDSDLPLSVQVHPGYFNTSDNLGDSEKGLKLQVKNEVWYVMYAEPDAKILCGIKPGFDKNDVISAIENGTLQDIMNCIPAFPGLSLYIPAGAVHSLPGGITVAEVQNNCDITYRLYDYNRTDEKGNPRELQIQKGMESIDISFRPNPVYHPIQGNIINLIAECDSFISYIIRCKNSPVFLPKSVDYSHILCIKGSAIVTETASQSTTHCIAGDSLLYLFNDSSLMISGDAEIILTIR